jgi:two-component system, LytTR family, sensor kinase
MDRRKDKPFKMTASMLNGNDFSNMDLENSDFSFSSLKDINFDGANLRNAKLRFSSLDRTTFKNADLSYADLSFSSMVDVDMTGAKVEGTNFSFTSQDKAYTWQDFNLIGLIQNQGWVGTVVAVLLGAIVLYGINAIIYFTAEIIFTDDPARVRLFQFLIFQNITIGFATILATQQLAGWLDWQMRTLLLRHVMLSVLIFILNASMSVGGYYLFGTKIVADYVTAYPNEPAQNAPWYWYSWGPVLVANVLYFFIRQGKQISRKISDQEIQLLQLEKLKTRAELDALQARINPHFLYNALNSIASLVHDDPDKAEEMTLLLSRLFRYTTGRTTGDYYDTIENELSMVETYLQVEKVRFGDRLNFSTEVTGESINSLLVPKFVLQPIVENAIKHGISKVAEQGVIVVKIYEQDGWLFLSVSDNGPAFQENMGAGYGIRSIQDKLKLLYGENGRIELHNEPGKSVDISIRRSAMQEHKNPQ